jgi:hypothetical protein
VSINGKGQDIRKGRRRGNMVEIFCIHVHEWKNEIIPGMGGGGREKR